MEQPRRSRSRCLAAHFNVFNSWFYVQVHAIRHIQKLGAEGDHVLRLLGVATRELVHDDNSVLTRQRSDLGSTSTGSCTPAEALSVLQTAMKNNLAELHKLNREKKVLLAETQSSSTSSNTTKPTGGQPGTANGDKFYVPSPGNCPKGTRQCNKVQSVQYYPFIDTHTHILQESMESWGLMQALANFPAIGSVYSNNKSKSEGCKPEPGPIFELTDFQANICPVWQEKDQCVPDVFLSVPGAHDDETFAKHWCASFERNSSGRIDAKGCFADKGVQNSRTYETKNLKAGDQTFTRMALSKLDSTRSALNTLVCPGACFDEEQASCKVKEGKTCADGKYSSALSEPMMRSSIALNMNWLMLVVTQLIDLACSWVQPVFDKTDSQNGKGGLINGHFFETKWTDPKEGTLTERSKKIAHFYFGDSTCTSAWCKGAWKKPCHGSEDDGYKCLYAGQTVHSRSLPEDYCEGCPKQIPRACWKNPLYDRCRDATQKQYHARCKEMGCPEPDRETVFLTKNEKKVNVGYMYLTGNSGGSSTMRGSLTSYDSSASFNEDDSLTELGSGERFLRRRRRKRGGKPRRVARVVGITTSVNH